MEFLFQTERGMMKGFADLVFLYQGKYYLLDWKSNYLGPTDADYTQERMEEAMGHMTDFLQASIYREALERYVKLFDNRPPFLSASAERSTISSAGRGCISLDPNRPLRSRRGALVQQQ